MRDRRVVRISKQLIVKCALGGAFRSVKPRGSGREVRQVSRDRHVDARSDTLAEGFVNKSEERHLALLDRGTLCTAQVTDDVTERGNQFGSKAGVPVLLT